MAKKPQSQSTQIKKRRFTFFPEIFEELKKVTWPSRREGIRLTLMVLAICAIVGLFLGALDYGFSELVAKVFLGGG